MLLLLCAMCLCIAPTALNNAEPVELAAASSDRRIPDFLQLVSPLGDTHFIAFKAHRLTWADLQRSPPAPVVLLGFVEWLTKVCMSTERGSRCRLVLAGHNIDRCVVLTFRLD